MKQKAKSSMQWLLPKKCDSWHSLPLTFPYIGIPLSHTDLNAAAHQKDLDEMDVEASQQEANCRSTREVVRASQISMIMNI